MSGIVVSNVFRTSGVIAATAAGINFQSSVVTGTTLTAEAGNGYFINTTSNICTITLPSSAEAGDQIILVDFARTWSTNKIVIDSNGLNYQGQDDTYGVQYTTSGATVNIVYSGASKGWTPISDDVVTDAPEDPTRATQKGIFAFGDASGGRTAISNLVNSSGVIASDTSAVGTARYDAIGTGYGYDKGIFRGGYTTDEVSLSNLVNNQGVIATDTTGVGTGRAGGDGHTYGGDKAINAYGYLGGSINAVSNIRQLISNQGVVGSDLSGAGTARYNVAASAYGSGGTGLFYNGRNSGGTALSVSNLTSNTGVVSSDVSAVGLPRNYLAGAQYGTDTAIFAFGEISGAHKTINLVNNQGVVASNTTSSNSVTSRYGLSACRFGGDKSIFCYANSQQTMSNIISNQGVMASDVSGVGTGRIYGGALSFSQNA